MSATSLVGRVARLPLRMIPPSTVMPILRGPLKGAKWIVGSQRHAFWLGTYEPYFQRLLARYLTDSAIFFDIGANVGFYSLLAANLASRGRVVAFEPLPENVVFLRRHLALNAIRNVDVVETAVSDRNGFAAFGQEPTRAMGHLSNDGDLQVETTTLDTFLQDQKNPPPTHIKMDIEGAEFAALTGAKDCFRKYRPVLFLATHGRDVHQDCCRLLQSWSYRIEPICRQDEDRADLLALPL